MKPATATFFLNMNTRQGFVFGQKYSFCKDVHVYAHDRFTEVVAIGVCSAY